MRAAGERARIVMGLAREAGEDRMLGIVASNGLRDPRRANVDPRTEKEHR